MVAEFDIPGLGKPTRGTDGILRWGTGDAVPLPLSPAAGCASGKSCQVPRWAVWAAVAGAVSCMLSNVLAAVALGVAIAK